MLRHMFTLIWKRKRSNGLIIAEIAIAFIVVFVLTAVALRAYYLSQQPLGFNYNNMWQITIHNPNPWDHEKDSIQLEQLLRILKQQTEIESVNMMGMPAFSYWNWQSEYEVDGKVLRFNTNSMDDGAPQNFGMTLVDGRWFGPEDHGQAYKAVIVNQNFVDKFFPGENVIGKRISENNDNSNVQREQRVVGVFTDFRQMGIFSELIPYVINRYDGHEEYYNESIQLKLNDGISREYEETLVKLLNGVAPNWNYSVRSWAASKEENSREKIIPLMIFAVIAAFLIIMVALGLFGVLWQNVTRRTHEIGLRRALGATERSVHWQIMGELLVIGFMAISIAFILLIQIPVLGIIPELNWPLFATSFVVSTLFMMLLCLLCSYYPGKVATTYQPATALHYE